MMAFRHILVLFCLYGLLHMSQANTSVVTITFDNSDDCKTAVQSISYGGECFLNQTSACVGNSLQWDVISGTCSFTNLGSLQTVNLVSYVAASFYYEDGLSCSLSSGTAALNCASFVPTTCNSTFVWNSRSTCSNCMSSAAVVDSLAGVVSFS